MLHHPFFALISLACFVFESYLEIQYYRAGFPKTIRWLAVLFLCGATSVVTGLFALIPEPIVMFQNIGAFGGLLLSALMGGGVAIYTAPKGVKEAERNRQRKSNQD